MTAHFSSVYIPHLLRSLLPLEEEEEEEAVAENARGGRNVYELYVASPEREKKVEKKRGEEKSKSDVRGGGGGGVLCRRCMLLWWLDDSTKCHRLLLLLLFSLFCSLLSRGKNSFALLVIFGAVCRVWDAADATAATVFTIQFFGQPCIFHNVRANYFSLRFLLATVVESCTSIGSRDKKTQLNPPPFVFHETEILALSASMGRGFFVFISASD